ncbi:MAG: binding-protein-dependent transport system inner rane component [Thermoleophilia bacterium]|nr:binding-protein-dependent transport system inner rane component [Thermoleophilia bacterium]
MAGHAIPAPGALPKPAVLLPEVGPIASGTWAPVVAESPSPTDIAMLRLKESRLFMASCAMLLFILVLVAAAPLMERGFAGRTAVEQGLSDTIVLGGKKREVVELDGTPGIGPGFHREYMLGADALGRDVFMRTLVGGRVSLLAGFGASVIAMFGAVALGTLAGYRRGWWDAAISRWADFMMCFPSLLLLVGLSTALATRSIGPIHRGSVSLLILILGVGAIAGMSRIIRGLVIGLAEKEFVEAAKAMGSSDLRIMARHMLPNISGALFTYFGLIFTGMVLGEAGLSYLGIGILPPQMSWGTGIGDGVPFVTTAWWITLVPGMFVVMFAVSVNLISKGIEEAFDPKNLTGS